MPIAPAGGECRPAIAVDASGRVHVSFYDERERDLVYAVRARTWTTTVVADEDDVGSESAIAIDPLGNPVIVYRDATRGDLRLLTIDSYRYDAFFPTIMGDH